MPNYRRWREGGATYFFTVVCAGREPLFESESTVGLLRHSVANVRAAHPFQIDAAVILPDHLHMIWTLPSPDDDFPTRWRQIKTAFTRLHLTHGGSEVQPNDSRLRQGERTIWQRRYWEHRIRDDDDYRRQVDYIHYNPVRHGLVSCPHQWSRSSFARWVDAGLYDADLACCCPRAGTPRQISPGPDIPAGE